MLADFRFAVRALRRAPVFALAAIAALALGTGANALIFSVVDGVLLRPLPYADDARLFALRTFERPGTAEGKAAADADMSPADLADVATQSGAFSAVGGIGFGSFDLTGTDRPVQTRAGLVVGRLFDAFRIAPLVGRVPSAREIATGAPVVVLDETFWRDHFAGDASLVGKSLQLDGRPYDVIGILPHVRLRDQEFELWTPAQPNDVAATRRNSRGTRSFARLADGVSPAAAVARLDALAGRLAALYPKENGGWRFRIVGIRAWVDDALRPALLVLLGAVALLLLIACTNVAHLLLARGARRAREVQVRAALGATRARLVWQMMSESIVLALLGSAAGVALAYLLLPVALRFAPLDDAQRADVAVSGRVMLVCLAVAALSALLFGAWPALVGTREVSVAPGGAGSRGATARAGWRSRGVLVASEIALASVLLVGAGLLVKSLEGLLHVERGFDPTLVASKGVVLPDTRYPTGASKREFVRAALERLRATPGITAAAVVNFPPGFGSAPGQLTAAGVAESMQPHDHAVTWRVASPDYFAALRIPILRGRAFDDADGPKAAKVAVIGRTLAARYFPGLDPIGRDVVLSAYGPPTVMRVVGVVGDVRQSGRTGALEPDVYVPYAQNSWGYFNIVVRGERTTDAALQAALAGAIRAVDPARPTFSATAFADMASADVQRPRFGALLMSVFAGVAALLSCVGVFGVMSYTVSARTREFGVRMALGSRPRDAVALVLRPGVGVIAGGTAAGLLAGLALSRLLRSQLYDVSTLDPAVYAGAAAAVFAAGTIACWLPARRAARVDPAVALRAE